MCKLFGLKRLKEKKVRLYNLVSKESSQKMAAPSGFAGTGPNGSFFEIPGWVDKEKPPG